MSGRHRKPTNTGRTVAKVALTGAVLGVTSVGLAQTASAAPDSDWDRLAQCESGGNWAINTGNGFQGGLQFSPSTWSGHGGGEFAANAHQATREQQIVVAERVLASQGWGAWPSCSSSLGLSSGATQRSAPAQSVPDVPQQLQVDRSIQNLAPEGSDLDANIQAAVDALRNAGVPVDQAVLDQVAQYLPR